VNIPYEIERRFLLTDNICCILSDPDTSLVKEEKMRQVYLRGTNKWAIRVREISGESSTTYLMTHKMKVDAGRSVEIECAIDRGTFDQFASVGTPPLLKTRYTVLHRGAEWHLDFFDKSQFDLRVAEVEIPHIDHSVAIPLWAKEEITDTKGFSNASLAKKLADRVQP
jgi:CYTH domain-containing protein